jgi:predicted DNA-binding protein (MmcQ/YjbR family)
MIDLDDTDWLVMKCDPDHALDLRDKYANILPAWHMNKKYWNQITQLESFSDDLICALVDHSYDEVVKKFSSRKRLLLNVSSL